MDSTIQQNTSGSLGGGFSNLGVTTIRTSRVRFNTGLNVGGVATGAPETVFLIDADVSVNTPDNCSPLDEIEGCEG